MGAWNKGVTFASGRFWEVRDATEVRSTGVIKELLVGWDKDHEEGLKT